MGFDEGQIILDSKNGTYYAGQTIFGKLVFHQVKVKTFRGIYVKIKGFAHNHWTSSHSRRVNDRTEHYTLNHDAHEEYFSMKKYLVGGENGEHHLQPGNHSFDFQCHIPTHCPSSFEHDYGHIRYKIKVVVDRAFKFDQEKEISIRVIAPLDLNQDPYCKEPLEFSFEDTYCCCCISNGYSETLVKIPVAGYCPGQIIPIELHCANKSSVDIDKIKLEIIKKMHFTAHNHPDTKHVDENILQLKKGPISANTTRNWTVEMEVPTIDVYNVNSCQIIDIYYEFKVEVVTEGCHEDSSDSKKIVFGSIPLRGYQDNVPNPLQDQMPMVQATGSDGLPQFHAQNYPNSNAPYPLPGSPYPGTSPSYSPANTPYHHGNSPYSNPPYPPTGNTLSTYPPSNPPYPPGNTPYPGNNPAVNTTFPNPTPQYPTVTPYPPVNQPYPSPAFDQKTDRPYSDLPPPYPATDSPYPNPNPGLGFKVQGTIQTSGLPPLPYPVTSVTLAPSAPEPSTPDDEKKLLSSKPKAVDTSESTYNYPYNPDFENADSKK